MAVARVSATAAASASALSLKNATTIKRIRRPITPITFSAQLSGIIFLLSMMCIRLNMGEPKLFLFYHAFGNKSIKSVTGV